MWVNIPYMDGMGYVSNTLVQPPTIRPSDVEKSATGWTEKSATLMQV